LFHHHCDSTLGQIGYKIGMDYMTYKVDVVGVPVMPYDDQNNDLRFPSAC
jgi:hypothetical protein